MKSKISNRFNIILLLYLFLLSVTSIPAFCDEFKVTSFKKDPYDITAINNQYKRFDDNDILCAIIKVRSDLSNLSFTASNPIVGNVEFVNGEYRVYVSEGTRQISVFAKGFIKLSYTFPERIEKGTVYILELTSKTGLQIEKGKGNLVLTSLPDSAEVRIDGIPDLVKYTPCSFNNYLAGNYKFIFSLDRYHTLDSVIRIEKETTKQIQIDLIPVTTSLFVGTTPSNADVFIDGIYSGTSPYTSGNIITGKHTVRIVKDGYVDEVRTVQLKQDTPETINVELRSRLAITIESIPTHADIWINGNLKGKTPLKTIVTAGENSITLKKKYYETLEDTINVNREKTYSFKLSSRKYQLKAGSSPEGASITVDGVKKGATPENIYMACGRHKIVFEKEDYYRKKKRVNLQCDQSLSVNLKQRYIAYFNLEYIDSDTPYDAYKAGFEMGWSYKNANRLITGFGYNYLERGDVSIAGVSNINVNNYSLLNTTRLPVDGIIEKKVNNYYLRMGLIVPRPVLLVVSGFVMYNDVTGHKVFLSDDLYKSDIGGEDLLAGDKFYDENLKIREVNIIYGIGVILPLTKSIQFSFDYFISNNFVNFTPKFMFGAGYRFHK